jgi:hypothetical protein
MSDAHREPPVVSKPAQPAVTTAHAPQHPPAPARRATHLRVIALAAATILAVAMLAFPRLPSTAGTANGAADSQRADLAGANAQPPALQAAPIASVAIAPRASRATSKKALVPKAERNRNAGATTSDAPIAALTTVADLPFKDGTATKLAGSEASATPASGSSFTGGIAPVTITGCLEVSVDRDDFRLTDTEGLDAPRSRSWRTGFLKKRSAPVALVEPPDRQALQTQVGRRVAATGLLTSHDLRVDSLRVVGPACD